jgi:hypothetical protein
MSARRRPKYRARRSLRELCLPFSLYRVHALPLGSSAYPWPVAHFDSVISRMLYSPVISRIAGYSF